MAGSIRDDGLFLMFSQMLLMHNVSIKSDESAKMVLMLSTMLHSIAVGNMLPAKVKVIAVDISQPVVTKLLDRGTSQL